MKRVLEIDLAHASLEEIRKAQKVLSKAKKAHKRKHLWEDAQRERRQFFQGVLEHQRNTQGKTLNGILTEHYTHAQQSEDFPIWLSAHLKLKLGCFWPCTAKVACPEKEERKWYMRFYSHRFNSDIVICEACCNAGYDPPLQLVFPTLGEAQQGEIEALAAGK